MPSKNDNSCLIDISSKVATTRPAVPQIYWYSTPEIERHDGCLKIGYTEQPVQKRIEQQTKTADVEARLEGYGNAMFEGDGKTFHDTDFRAYLHRLGYEPAEKNKNNEWVRITPDKCRELFNEYRVNRGIIDGKRGIAHYELRAEQKAAVEMAVAYANSHENGEVLWNAKPRFGKTLASYELCIALGAKRILIITNRPAIANSWYDDYAKFIGTEKRYRFISRSTALNRNDCQLLMTYEEYIDAIANGNIDASDGIIEFVGLQDLKGGIYFGGRHDKLAHISQIEWDILILDEAHEGIDTSKSDVAFDQISRKFTLHLSGTPFKAIASEKFEQEAIFNWSYADEQYAKDGWDEADGTNPYANLPRLNMFTYQMSNVIADKVRKGADIGGEMYDYTFDLNEFFATDDNGDFVHDSDVDRFLDALTTQTRFPFSTPGLREEMTHTLWLLYYVSSAKALYEKLLKHPVFGQYKIVLAAGDWRSDDDDKIKNAYTGVKKAIETYDHDGKIGTITLSVGQLTTGVTVPEWTGVMMLSNMKSPALYMQSAFRAQNPCLFTRKDGTRWRKQNAYVFDFDMTRTLEIVETFANGLSLGTVNGDGDAEDRKRNVRRLLNFFPVYGEDITGEMVELDAERVLSIPTQRRAYDVVRHGFMDNKLFQNIGGVFSSMALVDIIKRIEPCKEISYGAVNIDDDTADELCIGADGEIDVPNRFVVGKAESMFGEKVYSEVDEQLVDVVSSLRDNSSQSEYDVMLLDIKARFKEAIAKPLIQAASDSYGGEMSATQRKHLEKDVRNDAADRVNRAIGEFDISRKIIENEHRIGLEKANTPEEIAVLKEQLDSALEEAKDELIERIEQEKNDLIESAGQKIVREMETSKRDIEKRAIESTIRDHLRGFTRSIPSFLMAYGDDTTTLENFESRIPNDEFEEMTGITLDQFKLLRDGGDVQTDDGFIHVEGHLFDPVVFNASIKEFMRLRCKLSNYLEPSHDDDIFNYIPPQKTNQIFTPRDVIIQMLDGFEDENPDCFDRPDTTFIDPYMKSGMYITEIVKRLYSSERMIELFPDDKKRLYHIFKYQVFGIAPTQILYNITTNYILGVDDKLGKFDGCETNFACADTASLANEGKLQHYIDDRFGSVPDYAIDE